MAANPSIRENSILALRSGLDFSRLQLTPQEGYLVSRLSQPTTLSDLYALSNADHAATAALVNALIRRGVLVLQAGAAPAENGNGDSREKYGSFIFDLVKLNEDIDLDLDAKKEILYVHAYIKGRNYFEILSVGYNDPTAKIKKSFLAKSKKFHPDRFFHKRLGSYQRLVTDIYTMLSDAHFTLIDPIKKREYIQKLDQSGALRADTELARMAQEDRERRQRLAETMRKRRLKNNPLMERVQKARVYFKTAQEHAEKDEFVLAMNNLRMALSFDPRNDVYKAKLEEINDKANIEKANRLLQRAQMGGSLTSEDNFELFEEAAELGHNSHQIQFACAKAFLQYEFPDKGYQCLKRAAKLAPKNIDYKLMLGELLLRSKKREDAAKYFQEVLDLRPENAQAKEGLKEAKKWF